MKRSRFTEKQIVGILKEQEAGQFADRNLEMDLGNRVAGLSSLEDNGNCRADEPRFPYRLACSFFQVRDLQDPSHHSRPRLRTQTVCILS